MKLVITLCFLLVAVPVFATDCSNPIEKALVNACADHPDYDEKNVEAGLGADLVVYENDKVEVTTEYRWDIHNNDHKIYAVAKYNLWELFNK